MSDNTNPDLAHLWLDGDAFRAPAGTALPANLNLDDYTGWDAFGGIKAGFKVTKSSNSTPIQIWNADGDYKVKKDPESATIEFLPVDESKATVLTVLRGGSIAQVGTTGVFEWIDGDDEEFALLLRATDGADTVWFYAARCVLNDAPEEDHAADLTGYPISVKPLAPTGGGKAIRKFRNTNPLAA